MQEAIDDFGTSGITQCPEEISEPGIGPLVEKLCTADRDAFRISTGNRARRRQLRCQWESHEPLLSHETFKQLLHCNRNTEIYQKGRGDALQSFLRSSFHSSHTRTMNRPVWNVNTTLCASSLALFFVLLILAGALGPRVAHPCRPEESSRLAKTG